MEYVVNVSPESARIFKDRSDSLIEIVNGIMTEKNSRLHLIGNNPLSVMYNNHDNHVMFVSNLLLLNDFSMLKKTVAWVLSNYSGKGFKDEYFSQFLNVWIKVLREQLPEKNSSEIIGVYKLMLQLIEENNRVAHHKEFEHTTFIDELIKNLVSGNHQRAVKQLQEVVTDRKSLMNAYVTVIQPAMYEIGNMWEKDEISVSHEHLATSIIMRLMSSFYEDYVMVTPYKYKVVIAASMNEYHEIGARMVADFLEMSGYDVRYLGSNLPPAELIKILISEKPTVLGLSVSMSYNIDRVIEAINEIKKTEQLNYMKIIVGGYAFSFVDKEKLHGKVDLVLDDAYSALATCDAWWNEGLGNEV